MARARRLAARAFKLAARDRWSGWSAEQQFARLHLIAHNARFVILTPRRVANLASRVLGLSLRRLSQDMQAVHGYPVVLAETFVDPARYTARHLLDQCNADYVVTAIKDNQPTILDDLTAIDFSDAPSHETLDKAHGRIERRRCAVVDLSGSQWDGYADLYARRQAMRIEREREIVKTGERSIEVTYSLTSLGAERAGLELLLALVRNHWHIDNRVHYVRDFTYDEDRCRAYVRHLPRNLACLTNAAIAIVRCKGRFRYVPEANRHYAARVQDALDTILTPPTA